MNLFIDTPQRSAERLERERELRAVRQREAVRRVADAPAHDFDLDEVPGCESTCSGAASAAADGRREAPEPMSVAADAYREDKAFDRRRRRRRAWMRALRVFGLIILMPIVLVAVFLVSYALTCILNGATPDELAASFADLFARAEGVLYDLGLLPTR